MQFVCLALRLDIFLFSIPYESIRHVHCRFDLFMSFQRVRCMGLAYPAKKEGWVDRMRLDREPVLRANWKTHGSIPVT